MATKRVDPDAVVWIAPETLDRARGEFRVYKGEELNRELDVPALEPVLGDRVVWVNDSPEDVEDPSGHFEVYSGPDDEYLPVVRAEE